MKNAIKKLICFLAVIACVAMLFVGNTVAIALDADGSSGDRIEYYSRKYGSLEYSVLRLTISAETERKLNEDAEGAVQEGETPYTVQSYLDRFIRLASADPNSCEKTADAEGGVTYEIPFVDSYSSPLDENDFYEVQKRFFTIKYDVTYVNPLIKLSRALFGDDGETTALGDWQKLLAFGKKNDLPAVKKVFPCLKTADWSKADISYYRAAPKSYGAGNEDGEIYLNSIRYLRWDNSSENWEKLSYSYYRPYQLGWGVTISAAALLVALIIIIVTKKNKKSNSFADYRPLSEAETANRVESKIKGVTVTDPNASEGTNAAPPKDGYMGGGVFRENGRTVDVFGNDVGSASEDKKDENERSGE